MPSTFGADWADSLQQEARFIILKSRHKATGRTLDNDLLITLLVQKTICPMQQHLRL